MYIQLFIMFIRNKLAKNNMIDMQDSAIHIQILCNIEMNLKI